MSREPSRKIKDKVLNAVNQIPYGNVVTYGMVGDHVGLIARTVGWIMASLNDEEMKKVPWHRVVGAGGTIPAIKYGFRGQVQIDRLIKEGFKQKIIGLL
ncbi:cysteine methyltransferase [Candidatus Gracilibacteria bacterium]|nr:cysteine methyltransferase [Candidatus Gracilibacteria bacterium]